MLLRVARYANMPTMNPKDSLLEQLYQETIDSMIKEPKTEQERQLNHDLWMVFLSVAPHAAMNDAFSKVIKEGTPKDVPEVQKWARIITPMHCILFGVFLGFVVAILLRCF